MHSRVYQPLSSSSGATSRQAGNSTVSNTRTKPTWQGSYSYASDNDNESIRGGRAGSVGSVRSVGSERDASVRSTRYDRP